MKINRLIAVLMVMLVSFVGMASTVAATVAEDMANLTTTLNTLLLAIIPLIIMLGIFTYVLASVKFGRK